MTNVDCIIIVYILVPFEHFEFNNWCNYYILFQFHLEPLSLTMDVIIILLFQLTVRVPAHFPSQCS